MWRKKLPDRGHATPLQSLRLRISAAAFFILLAFLALSPAAWCQAPPPPQQGTPIRFNNEFGVWGSYAPGSPHVIGVTSPRQFAALGFRYGRMLRKKPRYSLEYTFDLNPVEIMLQPIILHSLITPHHTTYITGSREVVYGGGVNPLGFKLNFLRGRSLQPFAASSGGFVASLRPIPIDVRGEEQFNFTFDFQLGLQRFNSSRKRAWIFGYKYQHISNAYRGQINPGVDLNTVFVGYSFYK